MVFRIRKGSAVQGKHRVRVCRHLRQLRRVCKRMRTNIVDRPSLRQIQHFRIQRDFRRIRVSTCQDKEIIPPRSFPVVQVVQLCDLLHPQQTPQAVFRGQQRLVDFGVHFFVRNVLARMLNVFPHTLVGWLEYPVDRCVLIPGKGITPSIQIGLLALLRHGEC